MKVFGNAGRKGRRGFSLVEIMIVVAVIAILASSVTNIMGGSSEKAKFVRAEKELEAIYTAFGHVYFMTGSTGFGADINSASWTALSALPEAARVNVEKFLNREFSRMKDPWGNNYVIRGTFSDGEGALEIGCLDGSTPRTNPYAVPADLPMTRRIIDNSPL